MENKKLTFRELSQAVLEGKHIKTGIGTLEFKEGKIYNKGCKGSNLFKLNKRYGHSGYGIYETYENQLPELNILDTQFFIPNKQLCVEGLYYCVPLYLFDNLQILVYTINRIDTEITDTIIVEGELITVPLKHFVDCMSDIDITIAGQDLTKYKDFDFGVVTNNKEECNTMKQALGLFNEELPTGIYIKVDKCGNAIGTENYSGNASYIDLASVRTMLDKPFSFISSNNALTVYNVQNLDSQYFGIVNHLGQTLVLFGLKAWPSNYIPDIIRLILTKSQLLSELGQQAFYYFTQSKYTQLLVLDDSYANCSIYELLSLQSLTIFNARTAHLDVDSNGVYLSIGIGTGSMNNYQLENNEQFKIKLDIHDSLLLSPTGLAKNPKMSQKIREEMIEFIGETQNDI